MNVNADKEDLLSSFDGAMGVFRWRIRQESFDLTWDQQQYPYRLLDS